MANKKFISMLCAAALSTSAFAGFSITSGAEDMKPKAGEQTVLWSDTFDAYENEALAHDGVRKVLVDGTNLGKSTYTSIKGLTLTTVDREDDSSYFVSNSMENDEKDKYITADIARFSTNSRGAKITFNEDGGYSANTGQDLVLSTKLKIQPNSGTSYVPGFVIGSTFISIDNSGIAADTWADVKLVYSKDGSGCRVYVNDELTDISSSDTTLSNITFNAVSADGTPLVVGNEQKSSEHPIGYPEISFNDMVVYLTNDGVTDETPEAETQDPVVIATPSPKPAAPEVKPEEGAKVVTKQNFNDVAIQSNTMLAESEQNITTINDLSIHIGSRQNEASTAANVVSDNEGDNYVQLKAGKFSNAARGPLVSLADNITTDMLSEGATATMAFAARLTKTKEEPAQMIFLANSETQKDGIYMFPVFTISTADGADYKANENEWITVKVVLSKAGSYEFFVNGTSVKTVEGEISYEKEKTTIKALPYFTLTNIKDVQPYTEVHLDNLVVSQTGDIIEPVIPATPNPIELPEFASKLAELNLTGVNVDSQQRIVLANNEDTEPVSIGENISVGIGTRSNGAVGEINAKISSQTILNNAYKFLQLNAGGTKADIAALAPYIFFSNNADFTSMGEAQNMVIEMTAQLASGEPAEINILKNRELKNDVAAGYANAFLAVTNTASESVSEDQVITDDRFVNIKVVINNVGNADILVDGTKVGAMEGLTEMPMITTNFGKVRPNTSININEIVVYKTNDKEIVPATKMTAKVTSVAEDSITVTAANAAEGGEKASVLVVSKDENGILKGITLTPVTLTNGENTVTVKVNAGDQVMIWNNENDMFAPSDDSISYGMKPLSSVYTHTAK